jgi:hypothetical protein
MSCRTIAVKTRNKHDETGLSVEGKLRIQEPSQSIAAWVVML